MSRRIRRTHYTERVEDSGARGFTVVNHMLLPKAFDWSLKKTTGIFENMFKFGMWLVKGK